MNNHLLLRVVRVVQETADSKTFYLQTTNGAPINYKAGQFLTLIVKINGREERRSYSLSSTPGVDAYLFITVKRLENGAVSRYLFHHIKPGDNIESLQPTGKFTVVKDIQQHVFIAAGSGVTPILSLLKQVLYHSTSTAVLIYQNANDDKAIFKEAIDHLGINFSDRFHIVYLHSQPLDNNMPQRLNNTLLQTLIKKWVQTPSVHFYTCGPKEFMRMVYITLKVMGFEEEQLSKESFVVDFVPPPPFINDTSTKQVTIHINQRTFKMEVVYPQNLLSAALKNGIDLPYSCRGGKCSACTATCIKGKVKMSTNEVLTGNDLEKGMVLTCVGYAETDLELRF